MPTLSFDGETHGEIVLKVKRWLASIDGSEEGNLSTVEAITQGAELTKDAPMPAVLPQGVPGCTLYVSPDLLTFFTMGTTSVFSGYAIPNANALAGAQFFHQLVMLETPTGSAITAITSSNALALTIGQW